MAGFGFGFRAGAGAKRRLAASVSLNALTLSSSSAAENSPQDTVVGNVLGMTAGSSLALIDNAGGRFALDGSNRVVTGPIGLDYETGTSHNITIRETKAGATNSPRDTVLSIAVTDVDDVAPVLSSATGSATGGTSANIGVTSDEANGTLYWTVLPAASAAPSAAAFIAGTTGGVATGSTNSPNAGSNGFSPTGLTSETAYKAHFFQRDAAGNNSNVASSGSFTTADITAPTLSSPTDAANGATGATLSVSTNEANGTLYWYVSASATPPSAADLKTGTGAVAAGSQAVSTTGVQNASATGLIASTTYYAHFLHRDAAGNDSAIVSGNGFTTDASGFAYDYLISTTADWGTIPAGILSGGGVVAVAPGTYNDLRIYGIAPSAPLTFRAINRAVSRNATTYELDPIPAANRSRLMRAAFGHGSANVFFDGLEFTTDEWSSTALAALRAHGTYDGFNLNRCYLHSGYSANNVTADVDVPYDPTTKMKYQASLIPKFTAGGALDTATSLPGFPGFQLVNAYVGDLVADGTYALTFSNSTNPVVTWTVLPTVTMTVAGGYITGTTVTDPGASNATTAANTGIGGLSNMVQWTGKASISGKGQYGIENANVVDGVTRTANNTGNRIITDTLFTDLGNAIKGGFAIAGKLDTISGCGFDRIYQDSMYAGLTGTQAPPIVKRAFNYNKRIICGTGDPGDPHADGDQLQGVAGNTVDWTDIEAYGNVVFQGATLGRLNNAALFWDDNPSGTSYKGRVAGNIFAVPDIGAALKIQTGRDFWVGRNTVVHADGSLVSGNAQSIFMAGSTDYGMIGDNITEILSLTASKAITNKRTNTLLGKDGASIAYSAALHGPSLGSSLPTTVAEAIAYYGSKSGSAYTGKGWGADGYVDFLNQTIDRTKEFTFVWAPSLLNQSLSTSVVSSRQCIIGGPDTGTFSVTGGQVTFSDNAAGLNETAPASSGTYTRGKFLKFVQTTAATGSTATRTTITFNGTDANHFDTYTQVVANYPQVNSGGAAYSLWQRPTNITARNRMILAFRSRHNGAYVDNENFMCQSTGGTIFRMYKAAGSAQMRFQFLGSSIVGLRINTPTTDAWHTHLMSIDFTSTGTLADAVKWLVDSVEQSFLTGSAVDTTSGTRTFSTDGYFSSTAGSGITLSAASNGTNLSNNSWEWLWHKAYGAGDTMPDLTDPAVIAAFSADRFATDGSVSGILGQPDYFVHGTLTEWNDTNTSGGGAQNTGTATAKNIVRTSAASYT